jgi:hypothetical protein
MSSSPISLHCRSLRQTVIRPFGGILATVLLVASCASSAAAPTVSSGDAPVSSSGGPVDVLPAASSTSTVEMIDTAVTAVADTSAPTPSLPATVHPMELTGSPSERATMLANGLADDTVDRGPAVLAAFEGAGLPVVLADGSSLTSTADPVGLPWSIVSSLTTLSSARSRVSLDQIIEQFGLIAPTTPFDAAAATIELITGLRAAARARLPRHPGHPRSSPISSPRRPGASTGSSSPTRPRRPTRCT